MTNSGTASGSASVAGFVAAQVGNGVYLFTGDVTNSGTASGNASAAGFFGASNAGNGVYVDTGNVANSGTASGRISTGGTTFNGGNGVFVNSGNVMNSGTASGSFYGSSPAFSVGNGIFVGAGNVTNSGTASGNANATGFGPAAGAGNGIFVGTGNVTNSGTASGSMTAAGPLAISGNGITLSNTGSVFNAAPGIIRGNTGVYGGAGSVNLTTAGVIQGTGGVSVNMDTGDDTVTLLSAARMLGVMDGGAGTDTFNVRLSGVTAAKRAEIQALFSALGTTGAAGTFALHGNNYSFVNFEFLSLATSSYGAQGLTHNERAIGRYLDNLTWFSDDMSKLFGAMDASGNVPAALNQLSPEMYDIYPEIAYRNALYSGAALDRRLSFLRGVGSPNSDFATLFDADHGVQLADAGGNAGMPADKYKGDGRRWTAWASGFGIFADKDADTDVTGYHAQTGGALIGADYRLDRNFFVGLSAGYAHTSADIDNYSSSAEADSYSFGAYAGYHNTDGIYADASVNGGWDSFETRRFIAIPTFERQAHSEHDGTHVDARLGAGWMKKVGSSFTLGPTFALQYVNLSQSAIREDGAGDVSLRISNRDTNSLSSLLGFRAAARFTADEGKVEWNPEFRARWVHEFLNGNRDITARFTGNAVGSFTVRTDDPRRDRAMVGVGVSATVSKRFTGYLQYDADLGGKGNVSHGLMGGVRVKF